MVCGSGRCILITICILQLVATVERQVFDFLGYMWGPIIGNFLQIIIVIVGLFGVVQYRPKVLIVYAAWGVIWLAWSVFVICFYLEVGSLSRSGSQLNLRTGNKSWWLDQGFGCRVTSTVGASTSQTGREIPPESAVVGCLLPYYYVEVLHAAIQCALTLSGFCVACYVIYIFTEEDDSSQPVLDELEYIKMRYRSPARHSFRPKRSHSGTLAQTTYYAGQSPRGRGSGGGDGPTLGKPPVSPVVKDRV